MADRRRAHPPRPPADSRPRSRNRKDTPACALHLRQLPGSAHGTAIAAQRPPDTGAGPHRQDTGCSPSLSCAWRGKFLKKTRTLLNRIHGIIFLYHVSGGGCLAIFFQTKTSKASQQADFLCPKRLVRRFQHNRHIVETGILHETFKKIQSYQPLADAVVTVYPAA